MARGRAIALAATIGVVHGSALVQAGDAIQEDLKAGFAAYSRGDFAQAEARYKAALRTAESRGERGSVQATCLNCLGDTYLARRQANEARPFYERALALTEDEPKPDPLQLASLHGGLLLVDYLQGRLDEAESHGRRALELHEGHAGRPEGLISVLNGLANIALRRGRLDEAETLYRRALAVLERLAGPEDPSSAIIVLNLARVLARRGDFAGSIAVAERALALQEKGGGDGYGAIEYLQVLSQSLRNAGRITEARRQEDRIEIIRDRKGPPATVRVGTRVVLRDGAVLRADREREAAPGDVALRRAAPAWRALRVDRIEGPWLHVLPEAPRGHHIVDGGLGGWVELHDVRPLDGSLEALTAEIEHSPETARLAYIERGILWNDRHEYDRAIADFDRALRIDSSDAPTFHNRGFAWLSKREFGKALADFDAAIRLDPRYAFAYNNRGVARWYRRDYAGSRADFDEAVRLDPNYAEAFANRVMILAMCPDAGFRDGRQAVASATRACELSGWRNPHWLESLAAACAEVGDFGEAVKWQEKALELHTNPEAAKEGTARMALYRRKTPYRYMPLIRGMTAPGAG